MKRSITLIAATAAALALAGCVEETTSQSGTRVASTPNLQEQACLAAVSRETGNGDVALLGSEFSEAGTVVRVGVGADRAPWKCIAYSDGSTAGVEFMGSEGSL